MQPWKKHNGDHERTVRQTIVETLEAPRLTGVSTGDFVKFKNSREIYERRLEAKNRDDSVNVPATSYRDCVDELVLGLMIRASWVKADSIDEITEKQIEECVNKRSHIPPASYDLAEIERGIRNVKLSDSPSNLETKIWELDLQYHSVLRNLGCSEFVQQQPGLAIKHILKRISHKQLRSRIMMTYQLQKKILKENYSKFMVELAREAQIIDRAGAASAYGKQLELSDSDSDATNAGINYKKFGKRRNKNRNRSNSGGADGSKSSEIGSNYNNKSINRKRDRPKLKCLNPNCGEEHLVKDCPVTSREYGKKLLDEFYGKNKKKRTIGGNLGACGDSLKSSAILRATFCNGGVEAVANADNGSDANIIPPNILKQIQQSCPSLKVRKLSGPVQYGTIVKNGPKVTCRSQVRCEILLHIRHGSTLALRNMEWMVCDEEAEHVVIGERVLCALGLNNQKLLEAASDRHGNSIDVPKLVEAALTDEKLQNRGAGTVQSLMDITRSQIGSTYHCDAHGEEDHLEESDVYVDLGDDPVEELRSELAKRVEEARQNGISERGAARLSDLLNKYESVFE